MSRDMILPKGYEMKITPQPWISVSERLPEMLDEEGCHADVLGYFPEYPPSIAIVWWNGSRWEDTEGFVKAPSHWMPLPPPPSE